MDRSDYLLVVTSRPEAAIEADWNSWYEEVHLPEIADCPGFGQAARYRHDAPGERNYLAVYEVDGPEALRSDEFNARRGWGPFTGKVEWTTRLYRRIPENEPAGDPPKE